jgi:DNA-binding NarL/FixJ family response regulator
MTEILTQQIDALTNESIIRPLTEEELQAYEAEQSEYSEFQSQAQQKLDAKASALAKLAALGLTEEEIAAL